MELCVGLGVEMKYKHKHLLDNHNVVIWLDLLYTSTFDISGNNYYCAGVFVPGDGKLRCDCCVYDKHKRGKYITIWELQNKIRVEVESEENLRRRFFYFVINFLSGIEEMGKK